MEKSYKGGCACGSVGISISGEVAGPYQCACRQCQRASGGAPAIFVMAPRQQVSVTGKVASFEDPTSSGNRASRSFCPVCGTAIYSEPAKSDGMVAIKLGALDGHEWTDVKAVFWTDEWPAWLHLDPEARQFGTQP